MAFMDDFTRAKQIITKQAYTQVPLKPMNIAIRHQKENSLNIKICHNLLLVFESSF